MSARVRVLSNFERTLFDIIRKNLQLLLFDINKLEEILENRTIEDIETDVYRKARRRSLENCRRIIGNLELLPHHLHLKSRLETIRLS